MASVALDVETRRADQPGRSVVDIIVLSLGIRWGTAGLYNIVRYIWPTIRIVKVQSQISFGQNLILHKLDVNSFGVG
jgi:hypothetical protein